VTYMITAADNGPNSATNAVMQTATPPGTSFASISSPSGWTCSTPAMGGTGAITCLSSVSGCLDGTASFALTVRVASCAGSSISDTATISSATPDAVAGNNSATQSTAILGASSCDDGNACTQDACNGASST